MKHFNRSNCIGCLRGQFVDTAGRTITIGGIFAFDYFVEIRYKVFGIEKIELHRFPNGKTARVYYNVLKRKR